jgi:FixJ family two-component response regulator/signal transduction histidine kinase
MVCAFGVESATLWQRVGDADEFARTHQSRADRDAAPGSVSRVADPASRKLEDIDGSLVVPLGVEGSVVGALSFATTQSRDWPDDLVSRARLLGEVLANMLARQAAQRREQEARAQAAHAVRVGTMGVFAASLVHELTQPLAASLANAETASELLAAKSPDLAELRATVADIVTDDRRVGELIQQLRRLLRRGESKRADLNVGELVAEIRRVLANDARTRGIAFDLDVPDGLPAVFGDRVQVQQVLLNLLTNAFDAVDALEAGSRHVALRAQSADGGVAIEVADTGVGMDATTRARIFEPFYTTKASGMGLGLVISRSIVATHGGSLGVDSSPGRGTTFKLVLPSRVREAAPVVERASIPVEGRGTIVVIDDDPSMRRAVQRQLRSVGYDVELHESPASYLERSATRDPLCIVSDVRMPGTSGLDLQAALAREARALPIVFISAHGDVQTTASALKAGAIDFLAKPFSKGELLAAVAQAVARGRELEATHAKRSEIETRRASLTPREREVFALVAEGLPNKIIADRLGAAEATVKIHRSRVMEKMRAGSVADLVRMAEGLDLRSSADQG